MEVQRHGFDFESIVINAITGLTRDEYCLLLEGKYTNPWDIQAGIHSKYFYSIKASKDGKSIGCGDIVRFISHCANTPFTIIVGCWKQKSKIQKEFYRVVEFNITPEMYSVLWGGIDLAVLTRFDEYVKGIPPGKEAQLENRHVWKEKRKQIYEQCGRGLMNIDAKIDGKNQRRTQCSVNLNSLLKSSIPHCIYLDNYKGINISYETNGGPRKFS